MVCEHQPRTLARSTRGKTVMISMVECRVGWRLAVVTEVRAAAKRAAERDEVTIG